MPNPFQICYWLRAAAFLLIFCAPAAPHAMTIDSELQLKYADTLFNDHQYFKAAEEYQRFIFFFPKAPNLRTAVFKAGQSFLLAREPDRAIAFFKSLAADDPLDALSVDAFFKLADCYLAMDAPSHAVVQLNNLIALSDDPNIEDRAYYRIAWINIDLTDWPRAKAALERISTNGRQRLRTDELIRALADASDIATKNPALAGTLSIVPGGGQLYCQRYEDALIAFVVNVGLIWAAHDAFDNEQYGLGGLLSFVGFGFYAGNIYGAVNDAHKYNQAQRRRFVDQLRRQQVVDVGPPDETAARQGLAFSLKIPF